MPHPLVHSDADFPDQPSLASRFFFGQDDAGSGYAEASLFFRRLALIGLLGFLLVAKAIVFCVMLISLNDAWGV